MSDQDVVGLETAQADSAETVEEQAVDLFAEDLNLDDLDISDEATSEGDTAETPEEEAGDATDAQEPAQADIPAHLQGKSQAELVEMVRNLESIKGTQGNKIGIQDSEIGSLRSQVEKLEQFANTYLSRELDSKSVDQPAEAAQEFDFLDNPAEAINQAIANSEVAKQLAAMKAKEEAAKAKAAVLQLSPNFDTIQASPEFAGWLQENPAMLAAAQQAHATNDVNAAANLANTFEKLTGFGKTQEAAPEVATQREQQAAALKGATPKAGKGKPLPTFKQSDMRRLRRENPNRYAKMEQHFNAAYASGRVIMD